MGVAALWLLLQFNLFEQPTPPDTTYHIYAAEQILEGHAIYRDVAIIKAPLSDFFTAFALVVGRLGNVSDTIAARILFLLVAAATVSIIYLCGKILFGSRLVGVIAALIVMGSTFFGESAVTGPEPKILVVLFSFATFLLIARRHWLAAGICAARNAGVAARRDGDGDCHWSSVDRAVARNRRSGIEGYKNMAAPYPRGGRHDSALCRRTDLSHVK